MESEIKNTEKELRNQLSVARKEIQNLRKQIRSLSHAHQTDIKNIKDVLKDFKCLNCRETQITSTGHKHLPVKKNDNIASTSSSVCLKPIGTIRTQFPEKRAVPRQTTLCPKLLGCIEITKDIFNNPEHSLDGLNEFSHLWIIYHFHKNESHPKAKIAPPRLCGERVGIFSTRSPHRPCPIGLSLVEIDRIDGKLIYFYGTDMVDGTPVLDIKPYIPFYDNPSNRMNTELLTYLPVDHKVEAREEPEGEETNENQGAAAAVANPVQTTFANSLQLSESLIGNDESDRVLVKVPNWIAAEHHLQVLFNDWAEKQVEELQLNKTNIADILKTDPRSVYLRTRYGSQIFTFQLGDVTVTCKFDDTNASVTVVQVRKTENLSSEINN